MPRLLILLLCLAACAPVVRKQPRQRLPTPSVAPAVPEAASPSVELVEVRVLVVSYQGAENAKPTVVRSKEEALERARMLERMAKSGDRLAELVRKYSDRAGASEDLGLFRIRPSSPGAFGKEVADTASRLKPGEISDPIETPTGYFVVERRTDPPTGPTRVSAKHILISFQGAEHAIPGVKRTEKEARDLAEQIDRDAKAGKDWGELAKNTDEPGSKETGGDLGAFTRGQMVPAFERVAFALPVGAISEVVQTPFGFHVIQRYE
ncbi:MAG TPA: peptidylprolyl isomerase [Polyangiales bacterium]|nr:peptidylprolyl isomerase [Polyangiales bacterium]